MGIEEGKLGVKANGVAPSDGRKYISACNQWGWGWVLQGSSMIARTKTLAQGFPSVVKYSMVNRSGCCHVLSL